MFKTLTRWATAHKSLSLLAMLAGAALPAAAQTGYALTGNTTTGDYSVSTFQVSAPATITRTVTITGLNFGQELVGLDVRPATGQLYALGYSTATSVIRLYILDPATGVLTNVGLGDVLTLGTVSNRIGFDFNPTVDRIRITAGNRSTYRVNPDTGSLANTDGLLTYATTDANASQTPSVGSSAYTNSYSGSTATVLYDIDDAVSRLVRQDPPNAGTLNTVGALGVSVNGTGQFSDLEIYYNPTTQANVAYLSVATASPAASVLYTVNLSTGAATRMAALGNGIAVRDIAIAVPTGVVTGTRPAALANNLTLSPNPVVGTTSLAFGLPRAAHVELLVTDALGRTVDQVDAGQRTAGSQTIDWSRKGQAAGLYFFSLRFDGQPAGTRQAALTE